MGRSFLVFGRWVGQYVGTMCLFAAFVAAGAATVGTDGVFGNYLNAFGMTFVMILFIAAIMAAGPLADLLLAMSCTRRKAWAGLQLAMAAGCAVSLAATLAMQWLAPRLDEQYWQMQLPALVHLGMMLLAAETGVVLARLQGRWKKAALGVPVMLAVVVLYTLSLILNTWAGFTTALSAGSLALGLALAAVSWLQIRRAAV